MGTGKTTVGRELARRLNMEFIDTDELIEEKERKTIERIFADKGEKYFREVERDIIKEVSENEGCVISIGGGSMQREENIINLKRKGTIFLLTASVEEILKRVAEHNHRPLLKGCDVENRIRSLLQERAPQYAKADFQIDTTHLSIEEVVERILHQLDMLKKGGE